MTHETAVSETTTELIGGTAIDPVTGSTVGYILQLDSHTLRDGEGGIDRLRSELELPDEASMLIVRTAPDDQPSWPGVSLDSRYLTRPVEAEDEVRAPQVDPAQDYTVEPASESTIPFIKDLLVEAIADAHEHRGEPVDLDELRATVDATFFLPDDGLVSFVARDPAGTLAGHITLRPGEVDELTDQPLVELVDMFILDEHRHTACTPRLLHAARLTAARAGHDLLGHVVWVDETGPDVYLDLQRGGWLPFYDLWRVALEPAPSPITR